MSWFFFPFAGKENTVVYTVSWFHFTVWAAEAWRRGIPHLFTTECEWKNSVNKKVMPWQCWIQAFSPTQLVPQIQRRSKDSCPSIPWNKTYHCQKEKLVNFIVLYPFFPERKVLALLPKWSALFVTLLAQGERCLCAPLCQWFYLCDSTEES